jgi:Fe-S cluster assembly scaffold protein SufB
VSFSSWRDCHEDWKEIKERLAAEEEERQRLEEEEEALGGPALSISIEKEEEQSAEQQKGVVEAQDLARALASVTI